MSRKQRVIEQARRILRTQAAAAEAVESTPRPRPGVQPESDSVMFETLGAAAAPAVVARAGGPLPTELPIGRAFAEQGARDIELGIEAMRKVELGRDDEISDQEQFGLEAIILLTGRPAILIQEGDFLEPPKLWAGLKDVRDRIKEVIRRVGRIEVANHPDFEWLGTGFLAGNDVVITNRHVAVEFSRQQPDRTWTFRAPMGASLNLRAELGSESSLSFTVSGIIGIHEDHDMALLRVEQASGTETLPDPLPIAKAAPASLEGRQVYVIGYPAWDGRRNDPEPMKRIFAEIYNVKRLQPGEVSGVALAQAQIFHDCSTLGGNSGSPVIDVETHSVLGLHFGGRFLENNRAVPLWTLLDDDLVRRGNLNFQ
jgi:hypothetical protein